MMGIYLLDITQNQDFWALTELLVARRHPADHLRGWQVHRQQLQSEHSGLRLHRPQGEMPCTLLRRHPDGWHRTWRPQHQGAVGGLVQLRREQPELPLGGHFLKLSGHESLLLKPH